VFCKAGCVGSIVIGCGFSEAAGECSIGNAKPSAINVDAIVQAVLKDIQAAQAR
jgi:hypothetical protein